MSVERIKYARDMNVIQAGQTAYDETLVVELGLGKTLLQAIKAAKTACQIARVAKAQELVDLNAVPNVDEDN
ncbi:MAG: hypothetical protein ACXADH_13490 [Candidatus Kariarchaeaceae archaeon]|jgi:hypothetical protein